jgi:hypothetical protein
VAFLLCGAWVDDKVVVAVDAGLYENWFLPALNERFITNDEGMPAPLLGFDTLYDRVRGILKISHMSAITKFATKHSLLEISSSTSPCTLDLHKQIKNFKYSNSPEEATETEAIGGAYRVYLGAMGHWAQTTMPQLKATTGLASKYMSRPTKLHFTLVIMMPRYCMYTVREGITLTFTSKDDFDGVLELLFFTDSDHVGNADDGTSNSGMVAFLNGNYFHGDSCGQKCLTMNTAESECIAMVKCLQFAIWTMLLLRELSFRLRYPIPILSDNVAAVLINCEVTHIHKIRKTHRASYALHPVGATIPRLHPSVCEIDVEFC